MVQFSGSTSDRFLKQSGVRRRRRDLNRQLSRIVERHHHYVEITFFGSVQEGIGTESHLNTMTYLPQNLRGLRVPPVFLFSVLILFPVDEDSRRLDASQ